MHGRAAGAALLRSALEGVLGGRTGLDSVDEVASAADVMSAGTTLASADASWAACRHGLRRAPGSALLPMSQWVTDPGAFAPVAAGRFVAALARSRSLAAAHHLAILDLVTAPAAVASGGAQVLPPTVVLTVQVVVANQGNVDEDGVEVGGVAMLEGSPGSPVPVQRTLSIAAGRSTTLALPGFAVQPGSSYSVQITAETPRANGPGPLVSATVPVQVQPATTVTAVSSSANPTASGRPVTYSADVSGSLTLPQQATGSVTFEDDSVVIPMCTAQPLVAGHATCSTTYGGTGDHAITAIYSGDQRFAGSTSPLFSEKVTGIP
jgi:hypothetical protein